MSLESITQQVKEEISKLNQVLHLLEGTGVKHGTDLTDLLYQVEC
jgi:hypothetical protein